MDDLDLGLDLIPIPRVGPGRQPKPLNVEFVRELSVADLQMAATVTQTAKPLSKIKDSHHALARCLATGMKEGEASLVTGYSPSRISVLKADPQFQDLLAFYRSTATDVVADFRARMVDMGLDALTELRDRLEDHPEDFPPGLLNEIVRTMADRVGHAPQRGPTAVTQINIGLADRMAKARERVSSQTRTINHE